MKIVFEVDNLTVNYSYRLWPNLAIATMTGSYNTDYNYICTLINTIFDVWDFTHDLNEIWCADSKSGFSFCLPHQVYEMLPYIVLLLMLTIFNVKMSEIDKIRNSNERKTQ